MRALAVIPWHSTDPQRIRSMYYVTERLEQNGIDYVLSGDPVTNSNFNRARAKNAGARVATEEGHDVIIFHDADMLIHDWEYETLIERANETQRLVIGFTTYYPLTLPGTAWLLDGQISDPWAAGHGDPLVGFSVGGIIAITVDAFNLVGGYDERWQGWGCEDFGFKIACDKILGPTERLADSAVHLWHEHGSAHQGDDQDRFNAQLLARYSQAVTPQDIRHVQTTD